ncbi:MAG: alpha/beta fold hydrolase [Anaerolineae bacterium]|nr:alpha/beta fold hydrolase [Anaerolineae bacterium]
MVTVILSVFLLSGCREAALSIPVSPTPGMTATATAVPQTSPPPATPAAPSTPIPTASPTPTATATSTATATPLPTATPDPYAALSIDALAKRTYGGGQLEIVDLLLETETFKRYLITYPSDGLTIYGFMNVPNEGVKFPVALVLHGYIDPEAYEVEAYTTRYADKLAEAGYFVIHPNFRNYPPSDNGPDPYRIGYATDVLNLIAILREQSRDPDGVLRRAEADYIHLMGHSMGGGVALRVATVWPDAVKAVILYGSMSGDERLNYEQISEWTDGRVGAFELDASAETLAQISPIDHLDRLQSPIAIHHSHADTVVPVAWSEALCAELEALGHPVACYFYNGVPHTFNGPTDELFMGRMIDFFREN